MLKLFNITISFVIGSYATYYFWNHLIIKIGNFNQITFLQAVALLALLTIVRNPFGLFSLVIKRERY